MCTKQMNTESTFQLPNAVIDPLVKAMEKRKETHSMYTASSEVSLSSTSDKKNAALKHVTESSNDHESDNNKPTKAIDTILHNHKDGNPKIDSDRHLDYHCDLKSSISQQSFFRCTDLGCKFTTDVPRDFMAHLTGHKAVPVCCYCNKGFSSNQDHVKHVIRIHGQRRYQCSYCPYRGFSRGHVQIHQGHNHPSMPAHIVLCSAYTKTKNTSFPPKYSPLPYHCPANKCEFMTFGPIDFEKHLKVKHPTETKLRCYYCKYKTSVTAFLMLHYRTHGLNSIHCSYCQFGCDKITEILSHLVTRHADDPLQFYFRYAVDCEFDAKFNKSAKQTENLDGSKFVDKHTQRVENPDDSKLATKHGRQTENPNDSKLVDKHAQRAENPDSELNTDHNRWPENQDDSKLADKHAQRTKSPDEYKYPKTTIKRVKDIAKFNYDSPEKDDKVFGNEKSSLHKNNLITIVQSNTKVVKKENEFRQKQTTNSCTDTKTPDRTCDINKNEDPEKIGERGRISSACSKTNHFNKRESEVLYSYLSSNMRKRKHDIKSNISDMNKFLIEWLIREEIKESFLVQKRNYARFKSEAFKYVLPVTSDNLIYLYYRSSFRFFNIFITRSFLFHKNTILPRIQSSLSASALSRDNRSVVRQDLKRMHFNESSDHEKREKGPAKHANWTDRKNYKREFHAACSSSKYDSTPLWSSRKKHNSSEWKVENGTKMEFSPLKRKRFEGKQKYDARICDSHNRKSFRSEVFQSRSFRDSPKDGTSYDSARVNVTDYISPKKGKRKFITSEKETHNTEQSKGAIDYAKEYARKPKYSKRTDFYSTSKSGKEFPRFQTLKTEELQSVVNKHLNSSEKQKHSKLSISCSILQSSSGEKLSSQTITKEKPIIMSCGSAPSTAGTDSAITNMVDSTEMKGIEQPEDDNMNECEGKYNYLKLLKFSSQSCKKELPVVKTDKTLIVQKNVNYCEKLVHSKPSISCSVLKSPSEEELNTQLIQKEQSKVTLCGNPRNTAVKDNTKVHDSKKMNSTKQPNDIGDDNVNECKEKSNYLELVEFSSQSNKKELPINEAVKTDETLITQKDVNCREKAIIEAVKTDETLIAQKDVNRREETTNLISSVSSSMLQSPSERELSTKTIKMEEPEVTLCGSSFSTAWRNTADTEDSSIDIPPRKKDTEYISPCNNDKGIFATLNAELAKDLIDNRVKECKRKLKDLKLSDFCPASKASEKKPPISHKIKKAKLQIAVDKNVNVSEMPAYSKPNKGELSMEKLNTAVVNDADPREKPPCLKPNAEKLSIQINGENHKIAVVNDTDSSDKPSYSRKNNYSLTLQSPSKSELLKIQTVKSEEHTAVLDKDNGCYEKPSNFCSTSQSSYSENFLEGRERKNSQVNSADIPLTLRQTIETGSIRNKTTRNRIELHKLRYDVKDERHSLVCSAQTHPLIVSDVILDKGFPRTSKSNEMENSNSLVITLEGNECASVFPEAALNPCVISQSEEGALQNSDNFGKEGTQFRQVKDYVKDEQQLPVSNNSIKTLTTDGCEVTNDKKSEKHSAPTVKTLLIYNTLGSNIIEQLETSPADKKENVSAITQSHIKQNSKKDTKSKTISDGSDFNSVVIDNRKNAKYPFHDKSMIHLQEMEQNDKVCKESNNLLDNLVQGSEHDIQIKNEYFGMTTINLLSTLNELIEIPDRNLEKTGGLDGFPVLKKENQSRELKSDLQNDNLYRAFEDIQKFEKNISIEFEREKKANKYSECKTESEISQGKKRFKSDISGENLPNKNNSLINVHQSNIVPVIKTFSEKDYQPYEYRAKTAVSKYDYKDDVVKPFACSLCRNRYSSKAALHHHIDSKHPSPERKEKIDVSDVILNKGVTRTSESSKRRKNSNTLVITIEENECDSVSPEAALNSCVVTKSENGSLQNQNSADQELDEKQQSSENVCSVCKKKFNSLDRLKNHTGRHQYFPYRCKECICKYRTIIALEKHFGQAHPNKKVRYLVRSKRMKEWEDVPTELSSSESEKELGDHEIKSNNIKVSRASPSHFEEVDLTVKQQESRMSRYKNLFQCFYCFEIFGGEKECMSHMQLKHSHKLKVPVAKREKVKIISEVYQKSRLEKVTGILSLAENLSNQFMGAEDTTAIKSTETSTFCKMVKNDTSVMKVKCKRKNDSRLLSASLPEDVSQRKKVSHLTNSKHNLCLENDKDVKPDGHIKSTFVELNIISTALESNTANMAYKKQLNATQIAPTSKMCKIPERFISNPDSMLDDRIKLKLKHGIETSNAESDLHNYAGNNISSQRMPSNAKYVTSEKRASLSKFVTEHATALEDHRNVNFYKCSYCSYEAFIIQSLWKHSKEKHPGQMVRFRRMYKKKLPSSFDTVDMKNVNQREAKTRDAPTARSEFFGKKNYKGERYKMSDLPISDFKSKECFSQENKPKAKNSITSSFGVFSRGIKRLTLRVKARKGYINIPVYSLFQKINMQPTVKLVDIAKKHHFKKAFCL